MGIATDIAHSVPVCAKPGFLRETMVGERLTGYRGVKNIDTPEKVAPHEVPCMIALS
ncbi:hypothetical protein ERY430_40034 [Erythrobacter sp. EC-HK427]|nr:hypothetical protein ERY430_40034 [Erythrobacter sp. EC-HK427]